MLERKNSFPDKKRAEINTEQITRFIREAQEIGRKAEIVQKEGTWIPQTEFKTPFGVVLMSDIHYGSTQTDYEEFDRQLDIVDRTPNMFLATNGDHIDNFSPSVLSSGMLEDPITPGMQSKVFVEKMKRMDAKGKIAWMNIGNHDDWVGAAGYDHEDSLADISAPIIDRMGKVNIVTQGGAKYRGAVAHQFWGKSKLNITNSPKRLLLYEDGGRADFAVTGHTHQSAFEQFSQGGEEKTAIVAGPFKDAGRWEKTKGISASSGKPGITMVFHQDIKRIQVFKDIDDARDFVLGQAAMEGGVIQPRAVELYKDARREHEKRKTN